MATRASEVQTLHTRLLRVTLEAEHSRAYWTHARPDLSPDAEAELAFREYWFGTKSMERVKRLLADFRARFAAFPDALEALRAWKDIDRDSRVVVCHWHLQLSDPLYRRFTGEYLVERRYRGRGDVTRDAVVTWVGHMDTDARWTAATRIQFASKLLSAAHAAGLVDGTRDPRPLTTSRVTAPALSYLLYLLRGIDFEGSLHDNMYLRSVGLEGGVLDDRLRTASGIGFRRVGNAVDFDWKYAGLPGWATNTLGGSP